MTRAGFPHSDTPGSQLGCQLPRAYRRLLRPSSALDAKASTMCPSQLVTHTTNPTHPHQPPATQRPHPTPPQKGRTSGAQMKPTANEDEPDVAVHTTHYKDARVHYPDLKQQPHTDPGSPPHVDPGTGRALGTESQPPPPPTRSLPRGPASGLIPQNPNSVPPPTRHQHRDTNQPAGADRPRPGPGPGKRAGECR